MKKPLSINESSQVSEMGSKMTGFYPVLKISILILFILLISATLHSQEVVELNIYLRQLKGSSDPVTEASATHLESLLKDRLPTVYIGNAIVTNGETQPLCVKIKAGSTDQLTSHNPLFNNIELITIKLKTPADLNFILDLTKLPGFTNLKYVYFLYEFKTGVEDPRRLFIPKTGITVLYKVSIPS